MSPFSSQTLPIDENKEKEEKIHTQTITAEDGLS